MAAGPKLQAITPGSALIADIVMQNFQALADYLRAMPANSLLEYKQTAHYSASTENGIAAPSDVRLLQYHRIDLGNAPEQLGIEGVLTLAPGVCPLGGGDVITLYWEKCTPINGNFPVNADVWIATGASIVWDATNTVPTVDDVALDGPPLRFCQRAVLTGLPAIADGDWLRCRVVIAGASAADQIASDISLKASIRG